jgi:transglutaminase-like putative cysteine protease
MRLHATCQMTVHAATDCPVVAMLRPRSGDAQWMVSERYELCSPWVPTTEYVDSFGNLCQRLKIPQRRDAHRGRDDHGGRGRHRRRARRRRRTPVEDLPFDALQYLLQSRYCPSDKMEDEGARDRRRRKAPGYDQVEAIRHWIHGNLEYKYGVSSGSTDALDTLKDGAGVCRDFSHVGIGMCRALRIPARLVVGYLHELDPMDMHAWFEAFVGGRWYTFDATQAQPRGGRIVVAYGRDAADVAFLSNYGPLEMGEMSVTVQEIPAQATSSSPAPSTP